MDEIASLKAILLERLRASSALAAIVGDRIYDVPSGTPEQQTSPYIRFGPFSSNDDAAECFESYDVTGQIDVYSWGSGDAASTVQSLRIAALIKDIVNALGDESDVELQGGHSLSYLRYRSKRSITASDGKTKHVPIVISAIVDKE